MKKYIKERIESLELMMKTSKSEVGNTWRSGQIFALKDIFEQMRYE